jgi:hypothetical protein
MFARIIRDASVSYPSTGEIYPGINTRKLCPFLVWKKPKE